VRLWTIHPKYLDPQGLVALWREALLARAVLRGQTRGYRHHPQLDRFRAHDAPRSAINAYLATQMGGSGGKQPVTQVVLRSVSFAGERFTELPANLTAPAATTENSIRVQGNIGLPILSRFRVITDFANASVFVLPIFRDLHLPFAKNRTGLTLALDGNTLRIEQVSPGSPAEIAGLSAGDRITRVDGIEISAARSLDDQTDWEFGPHGQVTSLTLSNGSSRKVRLRDYF
jgi:hypothetical protein